MTRANVTLEVYNVIDLGLLYIIMQDRVQDGRIFFISPECLKLIKSCLMFILEKKLPLFFCSLNHNNRPPSHMLWIKRSFYYCQNSFDMCTGMLSSIISDVAYNFVSRNARPIAVVTPHGMVTPK